MKYLIALFVLLMINFSDFNEVKAEYALECNNCTTTQYRALARASAPNSPGYHPVHVADVVNNTLTRFNVYVEFEQGFMTKFPIPMAVDPVMQSKFDAFHTAYKDTWEDFVNNELYYNYPTGSAYDLMGGNNQTMVNNLSEFIWDNSNYATQLWMYVSTSIQVLGKIAEIEIYVDAKFPDGSEVQMKIDGINAFGEVTFDYREGSAKTANNTAIPDNADSFAGHAGTYSNSPAGSNNSIHDFLSHAASWGIPVTTYSSGGIVYTVTCSISGGVVTCVARLDSQ